MMELKSLSTEFSSFLLLLPYLSLFVVKDVMLENSNLASSFASDVVPLPFKNGVKMDVDPKEDHMTSSTGLHLIQLERTDEAAMTEASLSYSIASSQVETEQGPMSEAEAGLS